MIEYNDEIIHIFDLRKLRSSQSRKQMKQSRKKPEKNPSSFFHECNLSNVDVWLSFCEDTENNNQRHFNHKLQALSVIQE